MHPNPAKHPLASAHFTLEPLTEGVYACIHRPGGAAFSNAGIVDLGDRTLVVDAFQTRAAASDLRQAAEALFERPVDTVVLTHGHNDHWTGACAFAADTRLLASPAAQKACLEWAPLILEDFQDAALWEGMLHETEQRLQAEADPRVQADLEHSISFFRYVLAEREGFQPRTPEQTFENTLSLQGSVRAVELRSLGRGHSEEDTAILLPEAGIAFIGDIGFFDSQPYLGAGDLDLLRRQIQYFMEADFRILVPGHGPVGGKAELAAQLQYIDFLEDRIRRIVETGGSLEEALQIPLPAPFDGWLVGGMDRFAANVQSLFKHCGGVVPEAE